MTTIDYTLLALFMSLGYGLIIQFWPEFPLSSDLFYTLILAILAKIGVDVVGKPAVARLNAFLAKRAVAKTPAKVTKVSKK